MESHFKFDKLEDNFKRHLKMSMNLSKIKRKPLFLNPIDSVKKDLD